MKPIHPRYVRSFIEKSVNQTLQFLQKTLKGQNKVINFKTPKDLQQAVDLTIRNQPCPQDELLKSCQAMLDHQVKPYHPHFHNQLFGGFDQYSMMGAMITPMINGSIYTYEIAPCCTIMENNLYEHLRKIVGWEHIDATMTPGGSMANFMGIHVSRKKLHPDFNKKGLYNCKPMKIFTSDVSHYSLEKGANLCGIGTDNIVKVKTDQARRMIPSELAKAIEQELNKGNDALMVNSTVGTTVEGNIDPVPEISQVCKKYKVWHHVDAAFGGAFIMSPKLIKKIGSLKQVDSITFDFHKACVVPLQCTVFMTQHKTLMKQTNSAQADYLFHKERASYQAQLDVGDKHLMCGRVIDIVKLWTYLKGNGWENIAKQVEDEHQLALNVKKYVEDRPQRFQLVVKTVDTFNVCFWYIPKDMNKKDFKNEKEYYDLLGKVTVLAKKYMIEDGQMLVGYSKSKTENYHWRTVMSNPYNTSEDIDKEMTLIGEYCEKAYSQIKKE